MASVDQLSEDNWDMPSVVMGSVEDAMKDDEVKVDMVLVDQLSEEDNWDMPSVVMGSVEDAMKDERDEVKVGKLFEDAMKSKWDDVIGAYKNNASLREQKITRSGDTALQIAVSDNRADVVSKLVNVIGFEGRENALAILRIQNETGDTALHLAATIGNLDMCHAMAEKYPELIKMQNNEYETPIFSSVLHGKKKAYLCLNSHYKDKYKITDYTLCRRGNGDTILHCAISSNYFDLAYKIIQDYPEIVDFINGSGLYPLHVLANEHNAFQSGSFPGMIDRFIYHCILVDHLPEEKEDNILRYLYDYSESQTSDYPESYVDCMILFRLMKDFFEVVRENISVIIEYGNRILCKLWEICGFSRKENPQEIDRSSKSETEPPPCAKETGKQDGKREVYPPNYETIVLYFKLILNVLLTVLGLGLRIQKIKENKQQHIWANFLMNKLVERDSFYKYDDSGRKPLNSEFPELLPSPSMDTDITASASSSSATDEAKYVTCTNQKDKIGEPTLVAAKIVMADLVKLMDKYLAAIQELNEKKEIEESKKKGTPIIEESKKKETPILIAAKNGVIEMVEKILDKFPVAIQDVDAEKKNVVLLAVEHRQTKIYNHLRQKEIFKETVFRHLDNQGNSALHLAAKFMSDCQPKLISGAALQMQWEMKWYKFVKQSMPRHFFAHHNNEGKTPKEIFTNAHKDIVTKGGEWLTKTSESCSVVAALIATVAFATSATVPGGVKQETGEPTLENQPAFDIFAISSLVALSFSVTALVFFLSILTSRYQENDFTIALPRKLLLGLTALFISIASILISFCAGHFFVLKDKLKYAVFPVYAATCLPVTFFAFAQLPLYFDLTSAVFNKEPQRAYKY